MTINTKDAVPVVEITGLSRVFGKTAALQSVDLVVPRGTVFGLVGENGAGKTTLIRHILGLYKAQTGAVRVFAMDPVKKPVEVLSRIGYLSEDRELPDWMRIRELIRYTRAFYPNWDDSYAEQLRAQFELRPDARVGRLSRGERAKAGLLCALAHRPELLLLDEPSSGLDPIVRRDILEAIIRIVADEGRTVIFSSHLLDEVERVSDRLAMITQGRLVLSGALDSTIEDHRMLTLRFPEPQSRAPVLQGALSCRGSGREWVCICNGNTDAFRKQAAERNAEIIAERGASLEEIFVARAGSRALQLEEEVRS